MLALLLSLTVTSAVFRSPMATCDRANPGPISFHSRGFGYVAEIFPARSRQNSTDRPRILLYSVAYPGSRWDVKAELRWSAASPVVGMPQAAIVSMTGELVTFDSDDQSGGAHALTIHDARGRPVASLALQDFVAADAVARLPVTDCGVPWREGAKFYFITREARGYLYVQLPTGHVSQIALDDGSVRRGRAADFPALVDVLSKPFPNELTEVWGISLRFSSITDVIQR